MLFINYLFISSITLLCWSIDTVHVYKITKFVGIIKTVETSV